ncbi:MAG: pyridoxal-phosphate dependent enzyme [Vicinamibacteria bacterium]
MSDAALLECTGCGRRFGADEPLPFRCPDAWPDDDVDHLVARPGPPPGVRWPESDDSNPFLRYRPLLYSHALALRHGLSDGWFLDTVRRLNDAIAIVDGQGFRVTPFARAGGLERELGLGRGSLWIKDETSSVAGSHKARHLMGLALDLAVAEAAALPKLRDPGRPLAISSCGNAALAAAVVAKASRRRLRVAIPAWAEAAVVARLEALGAELEVCARGANDPPGDPCTARFRERVRNGALPFTCQGSENGLTIDGGMTLGFELADQLRAEGFSADRLFVQVGGGALASATTQALLWAHELRALPRLPRLHAVQTLGVQPLRHAYARFVSGVEARLRSAAADATRSGEAVADWLLARREDAALAREAEYAAGHRSEYMRPVADPQASVATGILDDETYDWRAVVLGMVGSGGFPVVVDEATLIEARERGRAAAGVDADATGSAGLAGALTLARAGGLRPDDSVVVLFTGARR